METMRKAWTDERLDDLSRGMNRGFDRVDARFERVDAQFDRVHAQFDRVDRDIRDLRSEMDLRFNRLETRFDSMQRMTLAAYVTAVLGLIATQL
jgi:flagellar capping protein FliD